MPISLYIASINSPEIVLAVNGTHDAK